MGETEDRQLKEYEDFEEVEGRKFEESPFYIFKEVGQRFIGTLLGSHLARNPKSGEKQRVYKFVNNIGERWSIGGSADLNFKLLRIPKSTIIKITLTGSLPVASGTMKVFSVRVPKGTKMLPVDDVVDEVPF